MDITFDRVGEIAMIAARAICFSKGHVALLILAGTIAIEIAMSLSLFRSIGAIVFSMLQRVYDVRRMVAQAAK